jgi:hypothetical protein
MSNATRNHVTSFTEHESRVSACPSKTPQKGLIAMLLKDISPLFSNINRVNQ